MTSNNDLDRRTSRANCAATNSRGSTNVKRTKPSTTKRALLGSLLTTTLLALSGCSADVASSEGEWTETDDAHVQPLAVGAASCITGGSGGTATGGSTSGGAAAGGSASGGAGSSSAVYGTRSSVNVLFSGHSLLDNPITDWTAAIARAKGDAVGWEQQILIGSPIAARTKGDNNGTPWNGYSHRAAKNKDGQQGVLSVLTELASPTRLPSGQRYDTLLITERHDPLNTVEWENTIGFLRHYHDRLTTRLSSARTLLYQVWPDIDKNNPNPWITYQTTERVIWECIAEKANLSLAAEGRPRAVAVVPGSVVLAKLVQEVLAGRIPGVTGSSVERLNQIFSDNVHLRPLGQYVIASALYAALYGKSPVGANAATGLSTSTMAAVETLAWNEVSAYFAGSTATGRPLAECRTLIRDSACPAFYAIRPWMNPQNCAYWAQPDSPFNYPDDFLYPAP